jgi:uncharacterized membrane protein YgcG
MTKKLKKTYILVIFLVLFAKIGFSQDQPLCLYEVQPDQLKTQLALSTEQMETITGVIKMLQAQKDQDWVNYKGNYQGLIMAAMQRSQIAMDLINKNLNDAQKAEFAELIVEQKRNREFLLLKEGLCLNEEQAAKVKAIMEVYGPKHHLDREERNKNNPEEGEDRMEQGSGNREAGGMHGGGTHGGGRHGGMGMAGRGDDNSESFKKMNKEIESILTAEQKQMFEQFKKEQHKRFENRQQRHMGQDTDQS